MLLSAILKVDTNQKKDRAVGCVVCVYVGGVGGWGAARCVATPDTDCAKKKKRKKKKSWWCEE